MPAPPVDTVAPRLDGVVSVAPRLDGVIPSHLAPAAQPVVVAAPALADVTPDVTPASDTPSPVFQQAPAAPLESPVTGGSEAGAVTDSFVEPITGPVAASSTPIVAFEQPLDDPIAPALGTFALGTLAPMLGMVAPVEASAGKPDLDTKGSPLSRVAPVRHTASPSDPVSPPEGPADHGGPAASSGAASGSSTSAGAFAIVITLSLASFWLLAFCFSPAAWRPVACLLLIERPG